ncbi:MAG: LysM peptidoglycan-binding domain-containing protein [Planctomycetaceae bacterium]
MHRDKRLGLALAILLLAAVGAFFFRNETVPSAQPPRLENPQALDAEIAEKPVAPYLTGDVETVRDAAPNSTDVPPMWAKPDFLGGDAPASDLSFATGTPDPIRLAPDADSAGLRDEFLPPHNQAWDAVPAPPPFMPQTPDAPSEGFAYRVGTGDTLSGLAERFLGSSTRFMEIYAANRRVLRNPNALRAGMTIRIPPRRRPAVQTQSSPARPISVETTPPPADGAAPVPLGEEAAADPQTAPPADQAEPSEASRRFVPVRRNLFLPRTPLDHRTSDAASPAADNGPLR